LKRLVLLGAGHAHLIVLEDFAMHAGERPEITLVTPDARVLYSGMVPGVIAGHYRESECAIDVAALVRRAGAALVSSTAIDVDAEAHEVRCADGRVLPYDVLSIDVGPVPASATVAGVERHAVPARPLARLLQGWSEVLEAARGGAITSITVVGGGAAGVELALAMDHALRATLGAEAAHVRIITDSPKPLPEFPRGARCRFQRHLAARNIGLHLGAAVVEVGEGYVKLKGGLEFASDRTFWVTGAAAPSWLRDSGFATDERGFVRVDRYLRSPSHPDVFAAGDCAAPDGGSLPKAGVFAVRAGAPLAHNLRAALAGTALVPHRASRRYLALVGAGPREAIGVWSGLSWEGRWVWRWKDRVDRGWVERFREP
jgi:selenide,water dikinase